MAAGSSGDSGSLSEAEWARKTASEGEREGCLDGHLGKQDEQLSPGMGTRP